MSFQFNKKLSISRWDFYSGVIFFIVILFQVLQWPRLPLFIDCYYHLSVVQGFADAGGWVGESFWEYAPVGRAHLYPPLLHILELFVYKMGFGLMTVARVFDFLIYPLFLFSLWMFLRKFFSRPSAFFSLFLLISSYPLYLAIVNNVPFSLAFIFGFWAYFFFRQKKFLSSWVFLVFCFFAHALVPWIYIVSVGSYCFLKKEDVRTFFLTACLSLLAASFFLYHQLRHISFFTLMRPLDFYYLEVNPLLYLFAIGGLVLAVVKNKNRFFLAPLFVISAILFVTYRYRFFSGQGVVFFCFFAAIFLDEARQKLAARSMGFYRGVVCGILVLLFQVFPLWLVFSPQAAAASVQFGNSVFSRLMGYGEWPLSSRDASVYHSKTVEELAAVVKRHTTPGEIVFSNYNYAGGMVALLSHRDTSSAMLSEVKPFRGFDPIESARLIVWFKEPGGEFPPDLARAVARYSLRETAETDLAYVYSHEKGLMSQPLTRSRWPFWLCLSLIGFLAGLVIFEGFQGRKIKS